MPPIPGISNAFCMMERLLTRGVSNVCLVVASCRLASADYHGRSTQNSSEESLSSGTDNPLWSKVIDTTAASERDLSDAEF